MADLNGFYSEDDKANEGFEIIPVGTYEAVITESEMKPTKDGNGKRLVLTFEFLSESVKGRKLWLGLNLENKSAEAVRIARGELAAIRQATGVANPKNSEELHDMPLMITVGLKKRKDNDQMENRITKFAPKGGTASPTAKLPETANGAKKAPWAKK